MLNKWTKQGALFLYAKLDCLLLLFLGPGPAILPKLDVLLEFWM